MAEIYAQFNILPSQEEIDEKNLYRKDKKESYLKIIKSAFQDLYEIYLVSKRFQKDMENIEKREGKKHKILFQFVAMNYIKYYLFTKAHTLKGKNDKTEKEGKKNIFIIHHSSPKDENLFD